jgi:tetratricopeptide (TPR) repeat protein
LVVVGVLGDALSGGVFINYRGVDSRSYGALLYAELSRRFGVDMVFLDSESIPAGADFVAELLARVRSARVVLALIGPRWLAESDGQGRRIDDPADWIRRELVEAFAAGVRVIPVLTDDARMPVEADLPADIAALSRCQYRLLRHRDASADLMRIVADCAADPVLAAAVGRTETRPRQLPAASDLFVGRHRELDRLTSVVDAAQQPGTGQPGAVVVTVIGGAGGIGKTWLAVHWAHQQMNRFPDGQLFVDLGGFSPAGRPAPPAAAVRGFLDALGIAPTAIPPEPDAQTAKYRSLVAGKRMLIVLDNAADTAQVTPLLPGSDSCTVLVTSRRHLLGLATTHSVRSLDLDVLNSPAARDLLARRLGVHRLDAEPPAVAALLDTCAGLPLALAIVAARAAAPPQVPLAVLAEELADATARLDALDTGEPNLNLRAVLSWSCRALPAEALRLFGLLGVAPGPDISLSAAAELTGLTPLQTTTLLRVLQAAHLLQQPTPDRYRMHDLIRLHAAEQANQRPEDGGLDAALRRITAWYIRAAFVADRMLDPYRPATEIGGPWPEATDATPKDEATAMAWLAGEHSNLLATAQLAADRGWHTAAGRLAWAMDTFHRRRGHRHDNLATWQAALHAADDLGDPTTQALAHLYLGAAYAWTRAHTEATDHLQHALTLAEQTGDVPGQIHAHRALTWTWSLHGDYHHAVEHANHALRLSGTVDNQIWHAIALNQVGWCHAQLGDHDQARTHCEAALTLYRRHHHRNGEADTLDSLGYIAHNTRRYTEALDHYRQALNLLRDLGNTYFEANTWERIGDTYAALGQQDHAQHAWRQALTLYQAQHRTTEADRIRPRTHRRT